MYSFEILGILFLVLNILPFGKTKLGSINFILFIFLYLFIRFLSVARWYGADGKNVLVPSGWVNPFSSNENFEGIELQFKKAMVPTSYILPFFMFLLLIGAPAFILLFANILLLVIAHVAVILLYFHARDKEALPVNYYTHNKHLKHDA